MCMFQIDQWLKKNQLPRIPLPNVCGYVPLVKHLTSALLYTPAQQLQDVAAAAAAAAVEASSSSAVIVKGHANDNAKATETETGDMNGRDGQETTGNVKKHHHKHHHRSS